MRTRAAELGAPLAQKGRTSLESPRGCNLPLGTTSAEAVGTAAKPFGIEEVLPREAYAAADNVKAVTAHGGRPYAPFNSDMSSASPR